MGGTPVKQPPPSSERQGFAQHFPPVATPIRANDTATSSPWSPTPATPPANSDSFHCRGTPAPCHTTPTNLDLAPRSALARGLHWKSGRLQSRGGRIHRTSWALHYPLGRTQSVCPDRVLAHHHIFAAPHYPPLAPGRSAAVLSWTPGGVLWLMPALSSWIYV